jgi:hypothetical protein
MAVPRSWVVSRMRFVARSRRGAAGHSAREERRARVLICGKYADQLSMPFALWTRGVIR